MMGYGILCKVWGSTQCRFGLLCGMRNCGFRSRSASASGAAAAAPAQSSAGAPSAGMTNNVAACLSYLFGWITGLIFLVIEPYKNDKFVRFHAFQSIFLSVGVFAVWIGAMILSTILGFITHGLGFFIMGPVDDASLAGRCGCGSYLHDQSLWKSAVQAAIHWRSGSKASRFINGFPGIKRA